MIPVVSVCFAVFVSNLKIFCLHVLPVNVGLFQSHLLLFSSLSNFAYLILIEVCLMILAFKLRLRLIVWN